MRPTQHAKKPRRVFRDLRESRHGQDTTLESIGITLERMCQNFRCSSTPPPRLMPTFIRMMSESSCQNYRCFPKPPIRPTPTLIPHAQLSEATLTLSTRHATLLPFLIFRLPLFRTGESNILISQRFLVRNKTSSSADIRCMYTQSRGCTSHDRSNTAHETCTRNVGSLLPTVK